MAGGGRPFCHKRHETYIRVFTFPKNPASVHTPYIHNEVGNAHYQIFQEWQLAGCSHPG
jgi:hypothetical protein